LIDSTEDDRMTKKQTLRVARVAMTESAETITFADGTPLEEMLSAWRLVHMTSLGTHPDGGYAALLLFEELPPENRGGRLGFGVE
jgi:hypothetical protein